MFSSIFSFPKTAIHNITQSVPSPGKAIAYISTVLSTFLLASMGSTIPAAHAASRVLVRLGPVQQSIAITDLEAFAHTGDIPSSLHLYRPVLTPEVQTALNGYLPFDPAVSDDLIADLRQSSTGEKVFEALELMIPASTPDKIEATLKRASQNPDGLSILGFIAAYPDETLTLDVSAAVTLASQLNLPHWQRGLINSVLERELTVEPSLEGLAFDPTQLGHDRIEQRTIILQDEERERDIPVDLYWSEWPQGPLVVISHGFAADRRFLNYLAEHLASYGLTVAAIEHPSSNVAWLSGMALGIEGGGNLSDILPITEFVDRPLDVKFLLDQLEQVASNNIAIDGNDASQRRHPFDTDQVTVIGHSLGGYTALALAGAPLDLPALREFCSQHSVMELAPADWLQCRAVDLPGEQINLHDPRVTQVVALNPVMARIFSPDSLSKITIPTLITAASEDSVTPAITQQLLPFANFQMEHKYLLTAIGATHLSMGDPSNLNPALTEGIMLRERSFDETEQMRSLIKALSLAFIKQQTSEAELYQPFLSPAYVQSWSDDHVQLRLSAALPPKLEQWLRMAALPMERVVSATLPKKKVKPDERSLHTTTIHWLSGSIVLMMFMAPAGLSLGSMRAMHQQWKPQRRKSSRASVGQGSNTPDPNNPG
ncbi:MAG: alpha/beta hydrolase [Leptolyngbyaceae bacterium]|nr:alpha/beta hydrolase [Leptolyngbyaceae bacterium]